MRDVFIVLGVVILVAAGVTLLRFRRDMKELFTWPVPEKPDPRREKMKARFARLGPSSPLREVLLLRHDEDGGWVVDELMKAVAARPRLEEETALLLKAEKWPDRILGFVAYDLVPTPSTELAALAASTVRDFARALPAAVSHAERDLWAAAQVCQVQRDRGFHDDAVAREYLRALRAHFGGRKDLEFIDATMVLCLDDYR